MRALTEYPGFAPSGTFELFPPLPVNDDVGCQWSHLDSQPKHSLTCAKNDTYPGHAMHFLYVGNFLMNPLTNSKTAQWYADAAPSDDDVMLLRGARTGSTNVAVKIGWDYVQKK